MEQFTDAERNELRAFIQTETGKKLLLTLVNQEMSLLAESYNSRTPLEKQGQIVNRVSGIYWCRTLIGDLIAPKTAPKK